MVCLNYELTLMVLCFVPFIVLFTVIFRKFSRRAYRKVKDATTDINTYLSENLSGIKVTQIFGREDEKQADFCRRSQALAKAKQEQIFVFGVFRPLVYMLYISSILCLFYLGGMGYLEGTSFLGQTLTSGTIVTFYMYIAKFFTPIQNLAEQFNWLQSALASGEKVFSIMDIQPKPGGCTGCHRAGGGQGRRSSSGMCGSAMYRGSGCCRECPSTSIPGRRWPLLARPAPARAPSSL